MMFMLSINEAPRQAMAMGGIRRWKDGRNMPDVHGTLFLLWRSPGLHAAESGHRNARDLSHPGIERHSGSHRIRLELCPANRVRTRCRVTTTAVFPAPCVARTRRSGMRKMIRKSARSRCPRRSASVARIMTT